MKVAIPQFDNRVSPHFDCASKVLIATVEEGKVVNRELYSLIDLNVLRRSTFFQKQGVGVVICGGISNFSARLLAGNGIQVVAMVAGDAEQVLDQFLSGTLQSTTTPAEFQPHKNFRLPGRRGRCRKRGKISNHT
jgi:predicted Fe-Mo cluster-binding NifX family protein